MFLFFLSGDYVVDHIPALVLELFKSAVAEISPTAVEYLAVVIGRGDLKAVYLAVQVFVVGVDLVLQVTFDLAAAVAGDLILAVFLFDRFDRNGNHAEPAAVPPAGKWRGRNGLPAMVVEVDVQGDIIPEESLSEMAGTAVHVHFLHVEILVEFVFGAITVMGGVERAEVTPFTRALGALIIIDIDMIPLIFDSVV